MSARLTDIQRRRDALVAKAAEQRDALSGLIQPWRTRLTVADRVIALARDARARWVTLAAGGLLISQLGRGQRGVWIARLWTAWDMYRALRKPTPRDRPYDDPPTSHALTPDGIASGELRGSDK